MRSSVSGGWFKHFGKIYYDGCLTNNVYPLAQMMQVIAAIKRVGAVFLALQGLLTYTDVEALKPFICVAGSNTTLAGDAVSLLWW